MRLRQWWRDLRAEGRWTRYVLQLESLPGPVRRLTICGLCVLVAAGGLLLGAWYGAQGARVVGLRPGEDVRSWVVPLVAMLALATGIPVAAAAVTWAGWRWAPHATSALAGVTTVSLVGNLGVNVVAVERADAVVGFASRLLLWSALLALGVVAVLVVRGRAPQPRVVGAAFALPWLAVAGAVVMRAPTTGWSASASVAVVWSLELLTLLPALALGARRPGRRRPAAVAQHRRPGAAPRAFAAPTAACSARRQVGAGDAVRRRSGADRTRTRA